MNTTPEEPEFKSFQVAFLDRNQFETEHALLDLDFVERHLGNDHQPVVEIAKRLGARALPPDIELYIEVGSNDFGFIFIDLKIPANDPEAVALQNYYDELESEGKLIKPTSVSEEL